MEAQHWGKLHLDSIDELWDIIDNSLRFFSNNLSLREELFYYALRQGYISFIFDGFDELCGQKTSPLDPVTVLHQLANIASKSEARILVTTRTLYWRSEIETPPANVKVVELDTFNTQQAKGYFSKYFESSHTKRDQALRLYRDLVAGSFRPRESGGVRAQFVNLPLCVAMVAAYVRQGGGQIAVDERRDLIENFLLNVCRREQERKRLKTSPARQLASFQELAICDEENMNPEFEFELLQATEFEHDDIRKIVDHPFLKPIDKDRYRFSYDFLGPYFRALSIAQSLTTLAEQDAPPDSISRLTNVMAREADGKGYVFEQLCGLLQADDVKSVALAARDLASKSDEAASFLTHVCKSLVDSDVGIITATERSECIFGAIQKNTFSRNRCVRNWAFFGVWERMDFRGMTFDHCTFENVTFRNCHADGSTCFRYCEFSGDLEIKFPSGGSWSEVRLQECRMSFPTDVVWSQVLGKGLGAKEEQMSKVLRNALGRFWYHGRPRLSMRLDDWNKGILRNLGLANYVLNVMLKVGLVTKISISGVSEGGIAFDKSSMNDLRNYMDNQQLQGKILEVFHLLIEE